MNSPHRALTLAMATLLLIMIFMSAAAVDTGTHTPTVPPPQADAAARSPPPPEFADVDNAAATPRSFRATPPGSHRGAADPFIDVDTATSFSPPQGSPDGGCSAPPSLFSPSVPAVDDDAGPAMVMRDLFFRYPKQVPVDRSSPESYAATSPLFVEVRGWDCMNWTLALRECRHYIYGIRLPLPQSPMACCSDVAPLVDKLDCPTAEVEDLFGSLFISPPSFSSAIKICRVGSLCRNEEAQTHGTFLSSTYSDLIKEKSALRCALMTRYNVVCWYGVSGGFVVLAICFLAAYFKYQCVRRLVGAFFPWWKLPWKLYKLVMPPTDAEEDATVASPAKVGDRAAIAKKTD